MSKKIFLFLGFIMPPSVFCYFLYQSATSGNLPETSVIVGYFGAIAFGLLFGFAIELSLNNLEIFSLRNKKMTKLENQYSKLLANTNKTQQDIDAFRIYCNSVTEI